MMCFCQVCGWIEANAQTHTHPQSAVVEVAGLGFVADYSGKQNNTGKKNDDGKPPMSLLPSEPLFEVARVFAFGAKKYATFNWAKGIGWLRVMSAVLRHCYQWLAGQDKDPETSLSHLAHAVCGLLFLLEYSNSHKELDDRYKGFTNDTSNVSPE